MAIVKYVGKNFRRVVYYDYKEVYKQLEYLEDFGYENIQIDEGTLGAGSWICIPPDDDHYFFVIRERYVNEWTSAHTISRKSKLSKAEKASLAQVSYTS